MTQLADTVSKAIAAAAFALDEEPVSIAIANC